MRHVRDRHDQPEALALTFAIHRVVEVLGGLAIDGDQRQLGQILAPSPVLLAHYGGQLARIGLGRRRKIKRQVVLAQGNLDLHAGVGIVAKHLDDAADGLRRARGLFDEFDGDDLAWLGLLAPACGDQDVLRQATVLGRDDHHPMLADHAANDTAVGALEHADHLAFRATTTILARDADHDAVAVQHGAHFLWPQEDVRASVVTPHKAEAVGVALDAALDQIGLGRQQIGIAAVMHDLAIAHHGAQAALEVLVLVGLNVQRRNQLIKPHRYAAIRQHLQHIFAAGQGLLVLLQFALMERVSLTDGAAVCHRGRG